MPAINASVQMVNAQSTDPRFISMRHAVQGMFAEIDLPRSLDVHAYITVGTADPGVDPAVQWSPAGPHFLALVNSDAIPPADQFSFVNTIKYSLSESLSGADFAPVRLLVSMVHPVKIKVQHPAARGDDEDLKVEFKAERCTDKRSDLVLSDATYERVDQALAVFTHYDKIFIQWGFQQVDPNVQSVLNFYGPPGTGKTNLARVIAADLGKPLLHANYHQIQSKYVGDSGKLIEKLFDAARKQDAVLYFDEGDAFLGKRIENMQSSSDDAVNAIRTAMLLMLPMHPGVIIFSTNLAKNFDKAFESRILAHVKFDLPGEPARRAIIAKKIPNVAPVQRNTLDNLLDQLAKNSDGLSGREIQSAVREAFCRAAHAGRDEILDSDFIAAFDRQREMMNQLALERGGNSKPVVEGPRVDMSQNPRAVPAVADLANEALAKDKSDQTGRSREIGGDTASSTQPQT